MKTPAQVTLDIERRLKNTWNTHLDQTPTVDRSWPHTFALGTVNKAELERDFDRYRTESVALRAWAAQFGVNLTDASRFVMGTTQRLPTHVTLADIDTAARLCGPTWTTRLARGRARLATLRSHQFDGDLTRIIRDVDNYSDLDFDLLCSTANWFCRHGASARGLTPRQVPVPGLQAKWLNSRHGLIATLADLPELRLLPPHPARIHFTYLDPQHRAAGGRWHDSASIGDCMSPEYTPQIVIITENKDTAIGFPALQGGVAVEGAGTGGSTPAAIEWLRDCPTIMYWGDMDAAGFTILNGYRVAGLPVHSILMDIPTYDTYASFGTDLDAKGNPIQLAARRHLPQLNNAEQELYDRLTDPAWEGHRRVEQERIPLEVALTAVLAVG